MNDGGPLFDALTPEQRRHPVNLGALSTWLSKLMGEIATALQQRDAHMLNLERRLGEVEVGTVRFCGTHQKALGYRKGAAVTYAGSLWVAVADAPEGARPGAADCWQLAVKQGAAR